jgi:hypothetical protein
MMHENNKLIRWHNWRQIVDSYYENKSAFEISAIFKINKSEVEEIIKIIKETEGAIEKE